jgi:hypothetical protein
MTPDELLQGDNDAAWTALRERRPYLVGPAAFCRLFQDGVISDETTFAEIQQRFGPGSGEYEIDWSALQVAHMVEIGQMYENDADGEMLGAAHAPQLIRQTVRNLNEALWDAVREGVTAMDAQDAAVNGPAEMPLDQIDWTQLQQWNEAILKNLAEGDSTNFWQSGGWLVIGDNNYDPWKRALEVANGLQPSGSQPTGQITMDARGSLGSRGSMTVTGSPDTEAFKAAVREFSQKSIDFA